MRFDRLGALAAMAAFASVLVPAAGHAESALTGALCSASGSITGVGASFAQNAHDKVFRPAYAAACTVPVSTVAYLGGGSGAGKTGFMGHTHMITGSDEPLSLDEQFTGTADAVGLQGRVSPAHHIPIALGSITVAVNLTHCGIGTSNGAQLNLQLRSQVIGSIFSGLITDWGDDLIALDNPSLETKLNTCGPVKPAVRSDGSGTTYAFKDFLSKRNPQFQVYKQNQLNTAWPAEDLGRSILRGPGNDGVAGVVDTVPGAIGYVELSEAIRTRAPAPGKTAHTPIDFAYVDSPLGEWISPRDGASANCAAAAVGMTHPASTLLPGWDAVSITDAAAPGAYPICTLTYLLVYNNLASAFPSATDAQIQTVSDYLSVALQDGTQGSLAANGYAPLPLSALTVARLGVTSLANA